MRQSVLLCLETPAFPYQITERSIRIKIGTRISQQKSQMFINFQSQCCTYMPKHFTCPSIFYRFLMNGSPGSSLIRIIINDYPSICNKRNGSTRRYRKIKCILFITAQKHRRCKQAERRAKGKYFSDASTSSTLHRKRLSDVTPLNE